MKNNNHNFVQVSKVLSIINSCETRKQLKSCLKLINNYVENVKFKGVINFEDVENRLLKEYKQKEFSLCAIKLHIKKEMKEFEEVESLVKMKHAV